MIVFLTSSPGGLRREGEQWIPTVLDEKNGFVSCLKSHWKEKARMLLVSSDPGAAQMNDSMKSHFTYSFPASGLSVGRIDICDDRDVECLKEISRYDVVILGGGHVPTQNTFFHEIHLKEALKEYAGIIIGISAGTMNCAETVYAQPELEGEATDPQYQRFLQGLGITSLMILPHYQEIKEAVLDGKRVIEDIACPDSVGREIYALVDGSYVLIEDGIQTLCGESYLIKDGAIRKICEEGQRKFLFT